MPPPRIAVDGLSKSFGEVPVLDGVHLEAATGEVHAVLGENGAGKSTLLRILAGAERADRGTVRLDGTPWAPADPAAARRAGVAMVHQELALCPHLDVAANVLLGVEPSRGGWLDGREARRRATEALARAFGGPGPALELPVHALPLADRQLVEIARALALAGLDGTPLRVLVLDEPTSSLGARDVERLFGLVRELAAAGTTVLYVSHFLDEVKRVADRVTVLRDGRSVETGDARTMPTDAIVRAMAGRDVTLKRREPRDEPGPIVLSAEELAGVGLPRSASFELRRGEILGIAGLVGAGRTELLRAVFGLDRVARGTLRVAGLAGPASPARRWAQGVGMASEDRKGEGLTTSLSIADNVTLSRLGRSGPALPRRAADAARRFVEALSIKSTGPDQRVAELSGGNQQKVQLARLLHHDVDVLLLDEPTRGIDVISRAQIADLVSALAAQGKAILLVSSHLPELLALCDRIAVMHRGRLGPARPARACSEADLLAEALGA